MHRDLKPSNLLITADGRLKLTDFGIAKDLDRTTQLTAPGRTLGTAAYMAPEQIRGTPAVSHKTDLYSLGVLLYQMLTGKPPFEGASAVVLMHCHLNEAPPHRRPGRGDSQGTRRAGGQADGQVSRGSAVGCGRGGAGLTELRDKAKPASRSPWSGRLRARRRPTRSAGVGEPQTRSRKKQRRGGLLTGFSSGFAGRETEKGVLSRLPSPAVLEPWGWWPHCWSSGASSRTGSGPPAQATCSSGRDPHGVVASLRLDHRTRRVFRRPRSQTPTIPTRISSGSGATRSSSTKPRAGPRRSLEQGSDAVFRAAHQRRAAVRLIRYARIQGGRCRQPGRGHELLERDGPGSQAGRPGGAALAPAGPESSPGTRSQGQRAGRS